MAPGASRDGCARLSGGAEARQLAGPDLAGTTAIHELVLAEPADSRTMAVDLTRRGYVTSVGAGPLSEAAECAGTGPCGDGRNRSPRATAARHWDVGHSPDGDGLRLTELVAAISLATDLVTGQPMEHALRTCRLAMTVANHLGLDAATAADVHFVALLRFLGCTADAPETAHIAGGDNLAFMAAMSPVYMGSVSEAVGTLARAAGRGSSLPRRAGLLAEALAHPRAEVSHCEVGARLAARLGPGAGVVVALAHAYATLVLDAGPPDPRRTTPWKAPQVSPPPTLPSGPEGTSPEGVPRCSAQRRQTFSVRALGAFVGRVAGDPRAPPQVATQRRAGHVPERSAWIAAYQDGRPRQQSGASCPSGPPGSDRTWSARARHGRQDQEDSR